MKYLIVPVNGRVITEYDDCSLSRMQRIVGGYIEHLFLPDDIIMVVNEDGYARGLLLNTRATEIASMGMNRTVPIAGDVILIGDEGEDYTDIPDSFIDKHRSILSE